MGRWGQVIGGVEDPELLQLMTLIDATKAAQEEFERVTNLERGKMEVEEELRYLQSLLLQAKVEWRRQSMVIQQLHAKLQYVHCRRAGPRECGDS